MGETFEVPAVLNGVRYWCRYVYAGGTYVGCYFYSRGQYLPAVDGGKNDE